MSLSDGDWSGQRCFVVGGGPSLRGFDWRKLGGENVIAVNRAYEKVPHAVVCSMDPTFWRLHGPNLMSEWIDRVHARVVGKDMPPPRPHVHVRVGDEKLPDVAYAGAFLTVFPCCADLSQPNPHLSAVWGESLESGLGCGGNSGFTAVNLADVLGASPIYLLGFDMKGSEEGGQAWWHDGYPGPQQKAGVYDRMRAAFWMVKHQIRGEVINLNLDSALQAFPKADPRGVDVKVLVIAGNFLQATQWAAIQNLHREDWVYVRGWADLRGNDPATTSYTLTGESWLQPHLPEILGELKLRGIQRHAR